NYSSFKKVTCSLSRFFVFENFEGGHMNVRWSRWISVSLLFLVCVSMAMAQGDTGTISGNVTDQSGATIPGVAVTIKNVETGISRNLVTNEVGRYDAVALPA